MASLWRADSLSKFLQLKKNNNLYAITRGITWIIKCLCFFEDTEVGTEQTLKRAKCLCLRREACGNGQSLANCLQLCSGISPLYASKVRHFRILTNSTNVGLSLKFVTLSSPHHISQNCFFSKAFKKKKKKDLEPYKRSSADF